MDDNNQVYALLISRIAIIPLRIPFKTQSECAASLRRTRRCASLQRNRRVIVHAITNVLTEGRRVILDRQYQCDSVRLSREGISKQVTEIVVLITYLQYIQCD